jgi:hypothetical protein
MFQGLIMRILLVAALSYGVVTFYSDKTPPLFKPKDQTAEVQLLEQTVVEEYIKAKISDLAPEKPVVGGSWYITNITVMPDTKTGEMYYEDGHIAGKASFSYSIQDAIVTISNVKKIEE